MVGEGDELGAAGGDGGGTVVEGSDDKCTEEDTGRDGLQPVGEEEGRVWEVVVVRMEFGENGLMWRSGEEAYGGCGRMR